MPALLVDNESGENRAWFSELNDQIEKFYKNENLESLSAICFYITDVQIDNSITNIPAAAFYFGKSLYKINISDNVTSIGFGAFAGCESLENISLSGVESIGRIAFNGCTSLERIDLSSIESIGEWAFVGCTSLKEINITSESLTSVGEEAFYDLAPESKIYVPNEEVKNVLEGKYDPNNTTVEIKIKENT